MVITFPHRERVFNFVYEMKSETAGERDARIEGPIIESFMSAELNKITISGTDPAQVYCLTLNFHHSSIL